MKCNMEIKRLISISSMVKICESVKNIILEWALDLEKEGILGEGLSFNQKEKEKAHALPSININQANIFSGNFNESPIFQENIFVKKGDKISLKEYLIHHGLENKHADKVIEALSSVPPESNQIKFFDKAKEALTNIGITIAFEVFEKGISQYLGLS
jgi:hypothetical protein